MRASGAFIHTARESPAEAELVSHRLMLRAGFVRKTASGIYSWLPCGWRVVRKITAIIAQEMENAGCAEIFMPALHPAGLWKESGRWDVYGDELLRLKDRHGREFCLGPTHEEVVSDILRAAVSGHRQLPVSLYQIQTKFRDEIRPRFGVMRAREFIMKDAYSFDADDSGMRASYEKMRQAYCRIFDRIGLHYRMVAADSGAIGGDCSHEFMVLADSGEETVLFDEDGTFAANAERVECRPPDDIDAAAPPPGEELQKIATPGITTIAALHDFLGGNIPPARSIKTMIVRGNVGACAVLLAGNHSLNMAKAAKQPEIGAGAQLVSADDARALIGAGFGSLGPVNMPLPVVADYSLQHSADMVCGANEDGYHFRGVNFGRDMPKPRFADIRMAVAGDAVPGKDGKGNKGGAGLSARRGIEVGHIFQLGDKYSKAMNVCAEMPEGGARPVLMGCYGIGVTRIAAAAIEQGNDERGIIFPDAIAPFAAVVIPISPKDGAARAAAEGVYDELRAAGVDVLFDDRPLRPGVMFAEADLLGIPHRLVISERGIKEGMAEYKHRTAKAPQSIPLKEAAPTITQTIKTNLATGAGDSL